MYKIIKYSKKEGLTQYDYVFKNFNDFYDISHFIKFPLFGVYSIAIVTTQIDDVIKFISEEDKYIHFDITIMMEEAQINIISVMKPDINTEAVHGAYDLWKKMIGERELLFDEYMTYKLYSSIEHTTADMMDALDLVKSEYPNGELLTRQRLEKIFILNDLVYPRQVLLKFLNLDRSRWKLLKMCEDQMDEGVIVGATVNNLKKMIEGKASYFKTGTCQDYLKKINSQNLAIAYKVFCTERHNVNSPFLLYKFYESGLSVNEIKGGCNVSI